MGRKTSKIVSSARLRPNLGPGRLRFRTCSAFFLMLGHPLVCHPDLCFIAIEIMSAFSSSKHKSHMTRNPERWNSLWITWIRGSFVNHKHLTRDIWFLWLLSAFERCLSTCQHILLVWKPMNNCTSSLMPWRYDRDGRTLHQCLLSPVEEQDCFSGIWHFWLTSWWMQLQTWPGDAVESTQYTDNADTVKWAWPVFLGLWVLLSHESLICWSVGATVTSGTTSGQESQYFCWRNPKACSEQQCGF